MPAAILWLADLRGTQLDSPRGRSSPDASNHPANDRLDSWGEIASYLRRGVRTVRRWEREEGLPVYRHLHRKSGSVYAFRSELDAWWNNSRSRPVHSEDKAPSKWTLRRWGVIAIVLVLGTLIVVWAKSLTSGRRKTPPSVRALAVLPFDDLSVNPESNIFADATTEDLITSLAQEMPLRIASRNSVMRYVHSEKSLQEIAQELNVDAVVRGSFQRDGQHVIITIRLVDPRSDRYIWAETYEGEPENILDFEAKTARTASNKIRNALNHGH